ncbi:MAG: EAL domain-containing protein [Thermodesulfobacteriota bacterium]|nr:EAL domain-containing protein [Thermodesulfobacteriota bacterium]
MSVEIYTDSNEKILRDLCDDLMGLVGEKFFSVLMAKLAQIAGADYAFIGQFTTDTRDIVRTVAVYADGQIIDNIDFSIINTPCDVVVKKGYQRYPHSVLELFPLDHLAIKMEVDSYVGLPLIDSAGVVIGPLAVFSRKPIPNLPLIETALHMIALRASSELERLAIESKRREEFHFLQSLLDAVPNPVFYKDEQGYYLGCNKSYEKFSGISRRDLIDCSVGEIFPSQRTEIGTREDEKVFSTLQSTTYESQLVCADGRSLDVLFNKAPFFNREGDLTGLVATIQDITSLRQIETAMQSLVESAIGYAGEECYRHVAEQLCQWFDADCAIIGRVLDDGNMGSMATLWDGSFIPEHCFKMVDSLCEQVVKDGVCLFADGLLEQFPDSPFVIELQAQGYVGAPVLGHDGSVIGVMGVLSRTPIKRMERAEDVLVILATKVGAEMERELSEQLIRENENHLEFLASHDVLTELPNRQLFRDRLQHAISMARMGHNQVAVLFLGLDRFKKINDSLGHELGDRLLCKVARRIERCMRDVDTVARLSGDEFAIILDKVSNVPNVILVAENIRRSLAEVIDLEGYGLVLTASIGISMYPHDGENVLSLLKGADAAMHKAKELGRDNYYFYTKGLNERASELLRLESFLRQAVDHNTLVVHYQPQIDLNTNKIIGAEALMRWQHPEFGMISPVDFIPMAEETGLIVRMGEWILRKACAQNRAWQQAGFKPIRISVNMSARQFSQKNLVEMVAGVLLETGLEPGYLDLEITESVLMDDVDAAIATMMDLHALGVQLSIDDFGTGYSSLAYLKRFPIDNLKIDQSFVRDVTTDPNDSAIATTIIDLARNMQLSVIAEGIEEEAQREFLHAHGCRYGQGYLFSRPVAAQDFEAYLAPKSSLL